MNYYITKVTKVTGDLSINKVDAQSVLRTFIIIIHNGPAEISTLELVTVTRGLSQSQ